MQLHTADRTSMVVQSLIFDTMSPTCDVLSHFQILCERLQCFSMKLHCETATIWACLLGNFLDMPESPYHAYRVSEGKHFQYPTMPYHLRMNICADKGH